MDLDSDIELYDSDIPALVRVTEQLRRHVGTRREKDSFLREMAERFAEAGFLVDIRLTTVDGGGDDVIFHPEVTISGRVDIETGYDHDRQRHEVRANLAGVAGQDAVATPVAMPGSGALWTPKGRG